MGVLVSFIVREWEETNYEGEVVWWRELLCGERARPDQEDIEDPIVLKQLLRDIEPDVKDTNVFLIETSCDSNPLYRYWCSVESWAQLNPEMKVWFVLTSVTVDNADSLHRDLLRGYSNLQIVGAHLDNIFAATPANKFFKSGNWTQNMDWVVATVSEMLRTALVWLYGGFYSDTDMMCLTNMKNFTNAIGVEGGHVVNSAFFTMQHRSPYLGQLLEKMTLYFHLKYMLFRNTR
ncbi:lactosylceramide 4-alpha-galactosyltransferase-like [Panulirus ornatus]|uniref:lactosylceramide 4-alpha-galactosyltransferase-like n=1 Tax=Panulirus ornatus TaxID=150431 RepID=UPI003A88349B